MRALTRRVLPGKVGQGAEMALGVKLAVVSLPVVLVLVLLFSAGMALVGGLAASATTAASSCGGGGAGNLVDTVTKPPEGDPGGSVTVPPELIPIYQDASASIGLNPSGPAMLAGINFVETDFGRDQGPSSAGAVGWMQFEPSTWTEYGDGGDPSNAHDAIFAAARLLKADGAPGDWYKAIFGYNHASWYVEKVEHYAQQFADEVPPITKGVQPAEGFGGGSEGGGGAPGTATLASCETETVEETAMVPGEAAKILPNGLAEAPVDAPPEVKQMIAAGNQIAKLPYVWGGHHAPASPLTGYDCSSAVSYVMNAAGLLPPGSAGFQQSDFFTSFVAADFRPGGTVGGLTPGPGQWVTVYSSGEHVFMEIAGIRFDDSGATYRNGLGTGAEGPNVSMWQPTMTNTTGFTPSHPKEVWGAGSGATAITD